MTKTMQTPRTNRFGDLFDMLTVRGRALLRWRDPAGQATVPPGLPDLAELLLSRRGEASGVALARALVTAFEEADETQRRDFLATLADRFGPDRAALDRAIAVLQKDPASVDAIEALHVASEPRRQELFRRLNLAPGGTAALVRMRAELLRHLKDNPDLRRVDSDFAHLFASWFNRGFLGLRHIDWNTPAAILEKIIRYEAVHAIRNWEDLRNRLQPTDRRCYGFFHPQLVDEPLIFVEVALTRDMPDTVAPLLDVDRTPIEADRAATAVFYSISNTQQGLAGVSFGNFLIKQVVEELKAELPDIQTFVTLSPVPGFAAWLARARDGDMLDDDLKAALKPLDQPGWHVDPDAAQALREPLLAAAAIYFLRARDDRGRAIDPVARFHLGNGACLERLNFGGDLSANGLKQSHGLMVNYLYDPDRIAANHEAFAERTDIAASDAVRRHLPDAPTPTKKDKP